jgi:hypothetical protein
VIATLVHLAIETHQAKQVAASEAARGVAQFFFDPEVVELPNARFSRLHELPPSWLAVPWWRVYQELACSMDPTSTDCRPTRRFSQSEAARFN